MKRSAWASLRLSDIAERTDDFHVNGPVAANKEATSTFDGLYDEAEADVDATTGNGRELLLGHLTLGVSSNTMNPRIALYHPMEYHVETLLIRVLDPG